MSFDERRPGILTLRDYLQVVKRRKWIILTTTLLVPAAALLFSLHQQRLYQASALVLLSSENLAAPLTQTQGTGLQLTPDRIAETQAEIARASTVAGRTLALVPGSGLSPQRFLNDSNVSTAPNADILTFAVTNHSPAMAQRLADAYAQAYTGYRRNLNSASIRGALTGVNRQISELVRRGDTHSALYPGLVDRQQSLQTMAALQASTASVLQQADQTNLTQPKIARNVALGVVLGLVLGVALAFFRESLDTRVRTTQEIRVRLGGIPLLARLATPPRRLRVANDLVMQAEPDSNRAEAFRMLRANLAFTTLDREVNTIMVTSAVEQEGKSTTAANLALAIARSGQRVVLVDLNLRRPLLARLFSLNGPGLTQVALGRVPVDQALVRISMTGPDNPMSPEGTTNGHGNGSAEVTAVLDVLPSGPLPPDPGEFVSTHALAEILKSLQERADLVLIDTPAVLHVGDAMAVSSNVDGILVVVRMEVARRHVLAELERQLATVPTPVLGVVVTGTEEKEAYGYESGYEHGYGPRPYLPAPVSPTGTDVSQ
jgi:receptor protein-tyrosine kinase